MQLLKFNKVTKQKKQKSKSPTFFSNLELKSILQLYSKQVAKGIIKDYAIDYNSKIAIFSFYKHSFDKPIFQIQKIFPKKNNYLPNFVFVIFPKKSAEPVHCGSNRFNAANANLFICLTT